MKQIVGVADLKVSNQAEEQIITYSLGSCLAVCIYDPKARAGGMLHAMLPDSSLDPAKAKANPFMFIDTGLPLLFRRTYELGATKANLTVALVGASKIMDSAGVFDIGRRNYLAARKMLWKNNVMVKSEQVGGNTHRTVWVEISTGAMVVREAGRKEFTL